MRLRSRIYEQYDKQFERRGRLCENGGARDASFKKPWLPKDKNAAILDLGCGIGETLQSICSAGYTNLAGVDGSEVQIRRAREVLPATVGLHHRDALDYLTANENRYDLIIAYDIIEHFTKDEAIELCDAAALALKPGGVFVAKVPNSGCILGAFGRDIDFTHLAGYTEYSLFQLFDATGFENHCLVQNTASVDLRIWRPWKPLTGLGLRTRINYWLHRWVYWLAGTRPPSVFHSVIEAWTHKSDTN